MSALDQVVIVFHKPQDPVHIAGAVLVMKNMGMHDMRLVQALANAPGRTEVGSQGTRGVMERIQQLRPLFFAL